LVGQFEWAAMPALKILLITYDMRIGGTEMVIKNIIEGADKQRFVMSIFCIEETIGPWGVELHEAGVNVTSTQRQSGFDVGLISKIRKHIKQQHIDIVQCHQYTPWVYGVLAALGTNAKVIFTEHGRFYPDFSTWKRKLINPLLGVMTHSITAISAATKQALADFENLPLKRIQVIYNGIAELVVDPSKTNTLRADLGIDQACLCFGTVARLDPIKNHKMMLHAFKQVVDRGLPCKLLIVGDGDERQAIEQQITDLKLSDHVIMTGYESKPQHHLDLMDVYLLSSFSEGTSMTLLEAMSLAKPCVVTHAGGNPEIVEDNINGLVTPNDDAKAFANAMLDLSDKALIKTMGNAARQRFNEHFSLHHMIEAYQALYLNLAATRRP